MFSDNTIIMLYFVIVLYTLFLVRYLPLYETLIPHIVIACVMVVVVVVVGGEGKMFVDSVVTW